MPADVKPFHARKNPLFACTSMITMIAACLIILLYGQASASPDQAVSSPPLQTACVTSECHKGMGTLSYVHGPIARGECTYCHVQTGKHSFKPISDSGKQCVECHEQGAPLAVVHQPVKQRQCIKCHDPHQSANKYQLRAAGADLCFLCHKKSIAGSTFVHGPVAVGSCNACHAGHQSQMRKLLLIDGNDLCFSCHTDKADQLKNAKFLHDPVKQSCLYCHNPHSAPYRYMVKADSTNLCYSCHRQKNNEILAASVKHKGLDTDKGCTACHDAHASEHPKMLVKQSGDLCLGCHDRVYTSASGRLENMKELLEKNKDHHGPIRQNDCSGCHNAHGSNYFRILRENFPPLFYAGYDPDNYKLCFMCHEKSLASVKLTTTLTGFRNYQKNLHFVHVNKPVKGRTCRACHDAHATNNPRHIRDSVPFGSANWNLPVGFTKTDGGGSCLPGCHKKFSYDREHEIKN
ncbi:cytochrome c3 family protein [Geomonas agri]|uniref:cytochrome c3 family protein n=1 Tax=Geomonas agri TaxID=2873702 RepID=UPI001CD652D7|nr:cytochrome c3 family protein [Geomonas agri]